LEYRVTDGLWGQASNMAVELIYEEKAVAIVGALDGRTSHLAEQVTAKSHVPYIETYASDPTLSKAFVPWFFQIIPNDYQVSKTFIEDIYNKHNLSKVAIISDNTYDGNIASSTFKKTISEENVNNPTYFFLSDRDSELIDTISRLRKDKFEAIVFLTNTANLYSEMSSFLNKTSARIYHIRYIEKKKKSLPSYSYHTILAIADSAKYNRFKEQFLKSDNNNPYIKSVYTYDAINLLIESVSAIGTDPISIGKTISEMEGYKGISGQINFNERGQLKRKVELSLIK
jgi:branched-chain amino acid transport system substrate-binding protein